MSKLLDNNNNRIDTSNLKGRLEYGLNQEQIFLQMMNDEGIYFTGNDNDTDQVFSWTDYNYSNDDVNVFLELKSRAVRKDKYKSTILALNKVQSYIKNKVPDKVNQYYIVFSFITDTEPEYYYIEYNKNLFKTFERCSIFNKEHYKIPISNLKPIEDFYLDFKKLTNKT